MDKLKPLIQHHFWILFGLVLILPLIGWMPAAKEYALKTTEKITQIDQAFSKVPAGAQPNKGWSEQLNTKAEQAEEKNQDARYGLWKRQEAMMTWPNTIKKDLQPKSYLEEISPIARNIYKNNYAVQVRNVWQKIDPFNVETGKGTVIFPETLMPQQVFGDLTPQSKELWDAQEDLWLLESLFKSIRRANSDASLVTESLVRSIKTLRLVGGPGEYPVDENANPDGMMMEGFEDPGMMPEFMDESGMGMEGGNPLGQFAMNLGGPVTVSFDPADEFGKEQGRYIDFKEGTVFKKRGFYLEAIIDHQRLPELLTILSNGSWPVTITRVQMGQAGSSTTSLMGGGMDGGMGGFSDMAAPMSEGLYSSSSPTSRPAVMAPTLNSAPMAPMGMDGMSDGMGNTATGFAGLAAAAEFGPQLALVAISGVIHIYNPPENLAELRDKASAAAAAAAIKPAPADDPATTPAATSDVPAESGLPMETPALPETPDTPEVPETPLELPAETPAAETQESPAPVPASDDLPKPE